MPRCAHAWRERLRYILVDEYQDTNGVQYELLKLLAGERGLFTAVGDDDQSIYGWRGATVENLKRLPADYPKLKVIALEQNYRSTGSILAAANAVIGHNPKLYEKKLWSDLGAGDPVALVECDDEVHEAERAVARIESLRASGAAFRDFAILYRANHQARVFEQALRKAAIPVQGLGRAELLRPRRDPRPLRLAAPDRQPRRRPGVPARRDQPEARHRPPDAGHARRLRVALEGEPLRGALRRVAGRIAAEALGRGTARVRSLRQRSPGARARHDRRRGREGAAARLAQGHRLRGAPARRRRLAGAGRFALEQRDRVRRLDRAPLRRQPERARPATPRKRPASSPSRRRSR